MRTATVNLDELKSHIGRTQVVTDTLHAGPANLLRLALSRPEPDTSVNTAGVSSPKHSSRRSQSSSAPCRR